MALMFAGAAIGQDIEDSTITASNGVLVSVKTIARAERREFYSPVVEGDSTDIYAGRIDINGASGALFLQGSAYYRGRAHLYDRAAFLNGELAAFKRGPVMVRECTSWPDAPQSECLWSEDFTVTVTRDEVIDHSNGGMLEVELSGGPTLEKTRLSIPVDHIYAVAEIADAH
ncbi:hypothetical protein VH88_08780 [Brevundimonas sp. KM4]|nr:hypothetical protein VH88_08780 [Brevundimonas sp. KM4]